MVRNPVSSTHLKAAGYDRERKILEIEFQSGAVYQYYDVQPSDYRNLIAAESVGQHFHRQIRGVFKHAKMGREGS